MSRGNVVRSGTNLFNSHYNVTVLPRSRSFLTQSPLNIDQTISNETTTFTSPAISPENVEKTNLFKFSSHHNIISISSKSITTTSSSKSNNSLSLSSKVSRFKSREEKNQLLSTSQPPLSKLDSSSSSENSLKQLFTSIRSKLAPHMTAQNAANTAETIPASTSPHSSLSNTLSNAPLPSSNSLSMSTIPVASIKPSQHTQFSTHTNPTTLSTLHPKLSSASAIKNKQRNYSTNTKVVFKPHKKHKTLKNSPNAKNPPLQSYQNITQDTKSSFVQLFFSSVRKNTTIGSNNFELNYQKYMAVHHPQVLLSTPTPSISPPSSSSSSPTPSFFFSDKTKAQIKATKLLTKKIFSYGRRGLSYMLGLMLLNELRVVLMYDFDYSPFIDSVTSLTEIGYISNAKHEYIERFAYDPYIDHIDTAFDIVLYIIGNIDRFSSTLMKNPVIDEYFRWITRQQTDYTHRLHSSLFFLDTVTDNALRHGIQRAFSFEAGSWIPPLLAPATEQPEIKPQEDQRQLFAPPEYIKALPTDRSWWFGKMFRFPYLVKKFSFAYVPIATARYHYFWPMTIAKWVKEILYKVALPIIDVVEWVAWAPQKYMAQRVADVFFFFDAKVAYHTRQFVQDAILSRYNIPLVSQLTEMRRERRSPFEISLFLLNYIGAASKESYRIIQQGFPAISNKDIDTAIEQLEIELQALQNTSQSEVELFAEHYRVYADNLPVYFNERLRPFLVRLSERPYDPLYKYFIFTYDQPASSVPPLQKDELLILDSVQTPYPITRVLTRWDKNTLPLKIPFQDWTEHNKLLPAHFIQGFENALSANFSFITKMVLWTAVLAKIPAFQRFFYRHLTLSYENRYKPWTYVLPTFSSMSITTALISVFLFSSPFEVYSSMWGKNLFYQSTAYGALAINIFTQMTNLTLARTLLSFNIHRPALLAPQNGAFPLLTMFWAYTARAFPDGDLRFFYFPIGTKVDALVSGWLALDVLGFFFFTLLLNRRTGIPHLSNLFGALAGMWLYGYHCKHYGVKPGEDYSMITTETTLPHINENIPDSFIFFNVFQEPLTQNYKMRRKLFVEDNDLKNLRYKRNEKWNADVATTQFLEGWNLLYRFSNHRDFVAVEENLNKLRQLRQEWRAQFGDEEVKRDVELGIEDKSIPYLTHTARFAQSQLERLQHIVDQAWSAETGMITPREWYAKEYEMYRTHGPVHNIEHAENFLNYNRLIEGQEYGFQMWVYPDEEEDVMYEPYIRSEAIWENLDQWLKWADSRGAIHWTAKSWEVFRLQPQLYPRMSETQKRWFHPQDEFYELDWASLRHIFTRRYRQEFNRGPRQEGLWGMKNHDPWYEREGLMNDNEKQKMRFARDSRVREGMMDPLDFPEMHHHPSRLWKAIERRRKVHKYVTFPKFRKDSNIAWGTRPKTHRKNKWFPDKNELDIMDDFDLEEPLFKHGEFNPFIHNLQGVRQPIMIEGLSRVRGAQNVEPQQWAGFERKLWTHIPTKMTPMRRLNIVKPHNMKVAELDKASGDKNTAIWHYKQGRKRNTGMRRAAGVRANMEDVVKGKMLETQQFWGEQRRYPDDEDAQQRHRTPMEIEWERDVSNDNIWPTLEW